MDLEKMDKIRFLYGNVNNSMKIILNVKNGVSRKVSIHYNKLKMGLFPVTETNEN
jgi:hypothetical protein